MANIDKSDENKKLKRQLRQAQSKIDKMSSEIKDLKTKNKILSAESKKKQRKLILSSLTEKEREIVELLTPLLLIMPLHMRVSSIEDCRSFNAARTIGKTRLYDIKKWRADNLLPNPSIKRLNLLKKVS